MPEHRLLSLGTTPLGVTTFACTDCDWRYTVTIGMASHYGMEEVKRRVQSAFRTSHATADSRELECAIAAGWLTQEEVDDLA